MNIKSVKKYNNSSGEFDGYKMTIISSEQLYTDFEKIPKGKKVGDVKTPANMMWSVPPDEANTMYKEIIKWVAEGNVIEEAD